MILNQANDLLLLFLTRGTLKTIIVLGSLCLAISFNAKAQTWDFETGNLRGWSATGSAFANQPTFGDNVAARIPGTRVGQQGNYWIGTFENRHNPSDPAGDVQGDEPIGTLTSAEFTINRNFISFLVGGGLDFNRLRVELLIKIRPGDPPPPVDPILALLGIGEIVRFTDGRYFVATHGTGRNTEVMRREVWDVSSFVGRSARIRVKDNATRPWGHINVDDFQFVDDVAASRVHVTDDSGTSVIGAEVYRNGLRMGLTDASGTLSISPPLTTGHDLVARKLVLENHSSRAHHAEGSSQDWNFRVYNTSMPVNNNGTVSPFSVTNPRVTQELQISRNNVLFGLHLVLTTEWDATEGELFDIRDNKLIPASQYLYNATDGQFFIEQVELMDDSAFWDDADIRVFANWSLRENSTGVRGRFLGGCFLCNNSGFTVKRTSDFAVYDHEFGHYGFDLRDEYRDDHPEVHCTASVDQMNCLDGTDSTIADFGTYQPKASCLMWIQSCAAKLCSNRPENPHVRGTNQGDDSCWTHLTSRYQDRDASPARWSIKTPDTRGAIVGMLPNLLGAWAPRMTIQNNTRANLCVPSDLPTLVDSNTGRALGNWDIWNDTFYGQSILEGKTSSDDPNTPEDEGGRMTATGVHVGDVMTTGFGGARFEVQSCTRARLERPGDLQADVSALAFFPPLLRELKVPVLLKTSNHSVPLGEQKQAAEIVVKPDPFDLGIVFEPATRAGQARLTVRSAVQLKVAPQVKLTVFGSSKPRSVSLVFDTRTTTYTALVSDLPLYTQANLQINAFDTNNQMVARNISVSLAPVNPKTETDLASTDGQLSLTIPAGALPPQTYIAIGPSDVPLPPTEDGLVIASGPFNVLARTRNESSRPMVLRFHLPTQPGKRGRAPSFDIKSFEIRHYNPGISKWERVGGVYLPVVDIVTLQTKELGAYMLFARPAAVPAEKRKIEQFTLGFLRLLDHDFFQTPAVTSVGEKFMSAVWWRPSQLYKPAT